MATYRLRIHSEHLYIKSVVLSLYSSHRGTFDYYSWSFTQEKYMRLKGKFSSGREGALASKFNYDFK